MKNAANIFCLTFSIICLAASGSFPARAEVISIGMLPVQDESGAQIPQKLLIKVAQDLKQKMTLAYQDVLVRPVRGVSDPSTLHVEQLSALGRKQGVRYLLRSGILDLKNDRALTCDIGLYAELITVDSGALASLRANGSGSDPNPRMEDARNWEAYNFKSSAFAQSALGQALNSAIEQLAQQVHQAVFPSGQPISETVQTQTQPPPAVTGPATVPYEADQELQQLVAQAESLVASGAASGKDISSLQQSLECLRNALNNKVSLMTQGQDTGSVDQEIAQRKAELQNIIAASTQEAVNQPSQSQPQEISSDLKSGISKVNELLGEALNCILKIQEIRTALQNSQSQSILPSSDSGQVYAPVVEPTSDVSGVVTDSSGNPVEGATVSDPQSGASATTDSAGSYVIPLVPSGRFATMKLFKGGKVLSSGKIQLQPGLMAFADWQVGAGGTAAKAPGIKILASNVIIPPRTGAQAAKSGTIEGVVRDSKGSPVARALVIVKGLGAARTDSQGRYMFVNVPQGDYQVMIRKGVSTVQTQQVKVAARKVVESKTVFKGKAIASPILGKQAVLTGGAGATLKGRIIAKNRQPLPGAKVTAVYSGGAISVFADLKGNYEFRNLKQGTYRLLANKAGYLEASSNVSLKGTQSEMRDFTLEKASPEIQKVMSTRPAATPIRTRTVPPATTGSVTMTPKVQISGIVRGRVTDSKTGKPLSHAKVTLLNNEAQTGVNGDFSFQNIPAGNHTLAVEKSNYHDARRRITVHGGKTAIADVRMAPKTGTQLQKKLFPSLSPSGTGSK